LSGSSRREPRIAFTAPPGGWVVAILDITGATTAAYTYDPYGDQTTATGPLTSTNPLGYTGAIHDPHSGLLKLGERWYNPKTGRFTQQDTIERVGDPAQGNRYAYAADNPVNNTDPTGMMSEGERDFWTGVGIVGAALLGVAFAPAVLSGFALGVAITGGIAVGVAGGAFIRGGLDECNNSGDCW
jgi:RHS repeat-associated protein